MRIGYARVSTADQNMHLQQDALEKVACERVFHDTASGAKDNRGDLFTSDSGASAVGRFLRPRRRPRGTCRPIWIA